MPDMRVRRRGGSKDIKHASEIKILRTLPATNVHINHSLLIVSTADAQPHNLCLVDPRPMLVKMHATSLYACQNQRITTDTFKLKRSTTDASGQRLFRFLHMQSTHTMCLMNRVCNRAAWLTPLTMLGMIVNASTDHRMVVPRALTKLGMRVGRCGVLGDIKHQEGPQTASARLVVESSSSRVVGLAAALSSFGLYAAGLA